MKLFTLNLNFLESKHGAWPLRKRLISSAIEKYDPDICVFQAVAATAEDFDTSNQARDIADAFRAFHLTVAASSGGQGMAVLSKSLPKAESALCLSKVDCEDPANRIVQKIQLSWDDISFELYNVHLSWVAKQNDLNIVEILQSRETNSLSILIGDFNQEADSESLKRLEKANMVNCAQMVLGRSPATFETPAPTLAIDHCYVDATFPLTSVEAWAVSNSDGDADISDHSGLFIRFSRDPRIPTK